MKTNIPIENTKAAVWLPNGVIIGSFAERNLEGVPRLDLKFTEIAEADLSGAQLCLTAPISYNYGTRRLPLDAETLEMSDVDVEAYLIHAAQNQTTLDDGRTLIETTLEETVAQMGRTPNDTVTLTQIPRAELKRVMTPTEELMMVGLPQEKKDRPEVREAFAANIVSETPVRAITRTYLCEMRPLPSDLVTVIVIATDAGFALGLWNAHSGLFYERAEALSEDYTFEPGGDESFGTEYDQEEMRRTYLSDFLRHALETGLQTGREMSGELGMFGVERMVVSTFPDYVEIVSPIITEIQEQAEIETILLPGTIEELTARGLLYSQIRDNPLEVVNLSRDLYVRLIDHSIETEQRKRIARAKAHNNAALAIIIPVVCLLAFIAGTVFHYTRSQAMLSRRDAAADAEKKRLEPFLNDRNSYVENFVWRESYLRQILTLHDRQSVAISFLPEIDRRYLMTNDNRFAFVQLKIGQNGEWQMNGVASNEEAVTNFVRGLEYAEGDGGRIFANLAPEFGKNINESLPSGATSPFKNTSAIPAGWSGWEIKGTYLPLANLAPKPATPAAPAAPAAQTAPNAAAPKAPATTNNSTPVPPMPSLESRSAR